MNDNMVKFQKKIEEMQRKLNIINEDIEEIKNERKSYDNNHKLKVNKTNTFLQSNNKKKNFFRDSLNNNNNINNNSVNYVHKNHLTNPQYYTNLNNTGRTLYQHKNANFNLMNENFEEIPKNHYIIAHDLGKTDINIKKDLTINYMDDYSNKNNNNLAKQYKSSMSTLNVNNENNLNFPYSNTKSIINKKKEDYFYKNNSLYQNYCHMKKNLNKINNTNINNFNTSQTINSNNIYSSKNKTFNYTIKDISSIKGHRRIKKIIVDKKIKNKLHPNSNKNFFNNEFNSNPSNSKNINKIYNDNHKTIDINYNYSYNSKNLLYDTNINKGNGPIKIKARNNNINNEIDNIDIKEKNHTVEDIKVKNQRSMSIENPKIKYPLNSKNLILNDVNSFHEYSPAIFNNSRTERNRANTEKINYMNNIINEKKNEHEKILLDIIDITNQYNDTNHKANPNNILNQYKLLLYDNKIKNEFIHKVINLYNKSTKSNLKFKDNESLIPTWNWIKDNQNKVAYNKLKNETENKQYKKICEDLMNEYNLKNIEQLKVFIHKLCKKIDKNDNFLEGIKKILLP